MSRRVLDYSQTINRLHPLNRGLVSEWCVVPWYASGPRWIEIAGVPARNHGTLTNGPTWQGAKGRQGGWGSLGFAAASSQYVSSSFSGTNGLSAMTIAFWLRLNSLSDGTAQGLFCKRSAFNSNNNFACGFNFGGAGLANGLVIDIDNSGVPNGIVPSAAAWVGIWKFVTITFNSATTPNVAFYIDGLFVPNANTQNSNSPLGTSTAPSYIGAVNDPPAAGAYLDGSLDALTIYNRALSADEALALYDETRRGNPTRWNWIEQPTFIGVPAPPSLNIDNRDATATALKSQSVSGTPLRSQTVTGTPIRSRTVTGRSPN